MRSGFSLISYVVHASATGTVSQYFPFTPPLDNSVLLLTIALNNIIIIIHTTSR